MASKYDSKYGKYDYRYKQASSHITCNKRMVAKHNYLLAMNQG